MATRQESATFLGLVTRLHPTSPRWRDGMADQCVNLRLGADDILQRRPGLAAYITTPCPTAQAPETIRGLWHVRFDETSVSKDYLIAHTGDGDADDDGKLWYWDLASLTSGSWTAILNGSAALGLADDEPGTAFVCNGIFYYSDSAKQWGWGPDFAAFTPGLAPPSAPTDSDSADSTSRILRGNVYYVTTIFNKRRAVESVPSPPLSYDHTYIFGVNKNVVTPNGGTGRVYRSLRVSATDYVSADLSHFYFVGEGTTVTDVRCDDEIKRGGRLNCRGGRPRICRYAIVHKARAWYAGFDYYKQTTPELYFDTRMIEWSSAGRVEEVARQYSLAFASETVVQMPELVPGLFMESRTFLPDEVGGGITGLFGVGGEVLVFTARQVVSIVGGMEPFAERVISRDVGLCGHWTLAMCGDWGLMGSDAWGPWVYDGQRFSAVGRELLSLSSSESAVNLAQLSNSLAVYVAPLREYWWFVALPGGTARTRAIIWQADRGQFTLYEWNLGGAQVNAAANVVLANAQPVTVLGLSNGYVVKVDESQNLADHNGAGTTVAPRARIRWWFGAESPQTVKTGIEFSVLFQRITVGKEVNLRCWACETIVPGMEDSLEFQYATSADVLYPVATVGPGNEGRFMALDMIIPAGCDAPITSIRVRYKEA